MPENATIKVLPSLLNEVPELTILNSLLEKLEDDESIKLSILHSELCFDNLLIVKDKINVQVLIPILYKFIIHCETDILLSEVISSITFLRLLKSCFSFISWKQHITLIGLILRGFYNNPDQYVNQFMIFFEHILENNSIPPSMINFLQNTRSCEFPTIIIILHYISLILKIYSRLAVSNHPLMGTSILTLLSRINNEDLSKVLIFLSLQSGSIDIRNIIVNEIVPSMLQLYEYLKSESLQKYPLLKERLENSIRNVFPVNSILNNHNFTIFDISYDSLNLLQVMNFVNFLNSSQTAFKGLFYEYSLFYNNNNNNRFPLFNILSKISYSIHKFCNENRIILEGPLCPSFFIFHKDYIIYQMMVFNLKLWISFTKSHVANDDLQSLTDLIPVTLKIISKEISLMKLNQSSEAYFNELSKIIGSLSYEKLRSWQIEELKGRYEKQWSIKFKSFDKILKSQVYEFIKKQRLSKLQRGAWVSIQNPLELTLKPPSVYFIVLSSSQSTLLIREFSKKTTKVPEIFDNKIVIHENDSTNFPTISIPLRSIGIYECEEFNPNTKSIRDHTYLINKINNQYLCEISLLTKKRKVLLNFFIENKEDKFIWFDGLQIVSPFLLEKNLSDETQEQINTLTKMIRQLQLMNLYHVNSPYETETKFMNYNDKVINVLTNKNDINNEDDDNIDETEDEDDIYNLETLKEISKNSFHN